MDLARTRLFFLAILAMVGFALYSAWQKEHPEPRTQPQAVSQETGLPHVSASQSDVPQLDAVPVEPAASKPVASKAVVNVKTDVLNVNIDLHGGDLIRAELLKYPQHIDTPDQGVLLLDRSSERNYVAQSGLIGANGRGPDSREQGRAKYRAAQTHFSLGNQDTLKVDLHWQDSNGLRVIKSYIFKRNNYLVDVIYTVENATSSVWKGNFYGQLRREFTKAKSSGLMGMQMYQGGALSTPDKPYKKMSFPDMKKSAFKETEVGGWAAMLERYFLSAYVPNQTATNHFYTRVDGTDVYNIGAITPVEVAPHATQTVDGQLYIGPEIAETLKSIAPGLNLTIDYGFLWPISQLLFWLLKTIHSFIGNWGWSIILVTLVIKMLFYKLSATSYRSMARMRKLQPRIEQLKERYKDDKQQFSTSLMELYRKEKMNPLGGCLPILVQIPVFIALYYVLLESVELRHAPFMFWIQDLSSKDPYYVLPLIMGATMFLQQRMNPAPPDPMQAKIMMFMPVVFTALFLSFPAGLVLYWTANNLLSILQQYYITRTLDSEGTKHIKKK